MLSQAFQPVTEMPLYAREAIRRKFRGFGVKNNPNEESGFPVVIKAFLNFYTVNSDRAESLTYDIFNRAANGVHILCHDLSLRCQYPTLSGIHWESP
jgi:hypothetical protein